MQFISTHINELILMIKFYNSLDDADAQVNSISHTLDFDSLRQLEIKL